jgi:RNA-directed DNA polymerase
LQESGYVMDQQDEKKPTTVAPTPKQAGKAQDRWYWVERSVWTERMLSRLESNEAENRVWFTLVDKTYAMANLSRAFERVRSNGGSAGVDRQTLKQFERRAEAELAALQQQLREGRYRPQPVRRAWIDKPGTQEKRPLGIPVVRDRIVQGALRHVLEPIFERDFAEHSYGFRPGRGAKQALRQVACQLDRGKTWVVDADLKSFFDTIPQERLIERLKERVADSRVIDLVWGFLRAGVMEEAKGWQPTQRGTPQGGVISPLLANIYLNPLDHQMAGKGLQMVRYADDFVVLCASEAEAQEALALITAWVNEEGLKLHPQKTRIVDATQKGGFDFLGYHFERGKRWPRKKSLDKLKDRLREQIPRNSGESLEQIVHKVNRVLRGWYGYFQHSLRHVFPQVDGFVRRRLRNLLERRHGRENGGYGRAQQRYPNAWFKKQGFESLESLHQWTVTIVKLRTH